MRLTCSVLLFVLLAGPSAADAQGTVPGSHSSSIAQQRAEYEAAARAHVDSLLDAWQRALDARDLNRLGDLYEANAVVVLSSGRRLVGRTAIRKGYARILPRMRAPKVGVSSVIAGGGSGRVSAVLTFEVPTDSGSSYAYTAAVEFALHATVTEAFHILVQEGGDIETIVPAGDQPADLAPGHGDSLSVQVVDATGVGIGGIAVTFEVTAGHGTIAPAAACTDPRGIATTYFTAGPNPEPNTVSAVAATLPLEAVLFSNKTTAAP